MTDGNAGSAHLDADELVSYAERTLPVAARARYTIHLADCARCRKIVAELAPAVSVSVRDHPEEQRETTFWQTMRHFFTLPVLKFAVPALGLFAIVVVGLVVFRQQPRSDMVARNEPAASQVAVTPNPTTEVPQEKAAGAETKPLTNSTPNLSAEQKAKSGEQGQATGAGAAVPAPGAVAPAVVAKDAPAEKSADAVAQPTFAPEPAPPAPKPQDQVADARKETAARTEAAAQPQSASATPGADRDAYARSEERAEQERSRAKAEQREAQGAGTPASNAAPGRSDLARLRTLESGRRAGAGQKADDNEAEDARSVAGRRFRRQGNLWVDTAYHSGLALTLVSRGSEQYRALVADEPAIRTIAEQLQGEVILIWKGRGYRIR